MISLTDEEYQKIQLLEKLFLAFNVADLREMTEREEIVAKLKGVDTSKHVLTHVINEHNLALVDILTLKDDVRNLVKIFNDTYKPYNQDLQNLKTKYGIY